MKDDVQVAYEKLWRAMIRKQPADSAMSEIIVRTLPDRDAETIRVRFGLTGEPPMSLTEVAQHLDTTLDGVREIEAFALRKLRGALATRGG